MKYYYIINIYDMTIKTCREATEAGLKDLKKILKDLLPLGNYTIAITIDL